MTPLMIASQQGISDIVRSCLDDGADAAEKDNEGFNAIYYAVRNNNLNVLQVFHHYYQEDFDKFINTKNGPYNRTPLMTAAEQGDLKMVQFLLDHKADVGARDIDGLNAASLAELNNNVDVVKSIEKAIRKATVNSSAAAASPAAKASHDLRLFETYKRASTQQRPVDGLESDKLGLNQSVKDKDEDEPDRTPNNTKM